MSASTRSRVSALLSLVGLRNLERRPLRCSREASSGACCSRTLSTRCPELLILDEPASGLDEGGVAQLEDLLRTVREGGSTVLMVSHDLDQVRRIADRVDRAGSGCRV